MSSRLQEIRAELYETLPTRAGCDYRIWLGLDHATIAAECGVIVVTRVRYQLIAPSTPSNKVSLEAP